MTAASPVSIYFSESVTPPFPPSRRNPPTMSDERHVTGAGDFAPCARAIAYIKTPACHQEWRNRIDREANKKVSRSPDEIERGKGEKDRQMRRLSHRLPAHR